MKINFLLLFCLLVQLGNSQDFEGGNEVFFPANNTILSESSAGVGESGYFAVVTTDLPLLKKGSFEVRVFDRNLEAVFQQTFEEQLFDVSDVFVHGDFVCFRSYFEGYAFHRVNFKTGVLESTEPKIKIERYRTWLIDKNEIHLLYQDKSELILMTLNLDTWEWKEKEYKFGKNGGKIIKAVQDDMRMHIFLRDAEVIRLLTYDTDAQIFSESQEIYRNGDVKTNKTNRFLYVEKVHFFGGQTFVVIGHLNNSSFGGYHETSLAILEIDSRGAVSNVVELQAGDVENTRSVHISEVGDRVVVTGLRLMNTGELNVFTCELNGNELSGWVYYPTEKIDAFLESFSIDQPKYLKKFAYAEFHDVVEINGQLAVLFEANRVNVLTGSNGTAHGGYLYSHVVALRLDMSRELLWSYNEPLVNEGLSRKRRKYAVSKSYADGSMRIFTPGQTGLKPVLFTNRGGIFEDAEIDLTPTSVNGGVSFTSAIKLIDDGQGGFYYSSKLRQDKEIYFLLKRVVPS